MDGGSLAKTLLASAAIAGAGIATYYFLSRSEARVEVRSDEPVRISRELLIEILKELLREFHGIFIELAGMVQRLKQLGALRSAEGPLSTKEIASFLMQQGVQAKLDAAQNRVLSSHGLTQSQIEAAQTKYAEDSEIQTFINGFAEMFEEASSGVSPILPGLSIPESLTEDKALEILSLIHQERVRGFKIALERFWASDEARNIAANSNPSQGPPPALAQALQVVHDQAESVVLQQHVEIVGDKATFDSAMAVFSRSTDGAFVREKLRMERTHQVEIVNLMRNRDTKESPRFDEPLEGLNERLQCSNEGDMAHQILEAAEAKKPVVAALVRNMKEPKQALAAISNALENGSLNHLVERGAVFLYMPAHDDIPLADRPEYKEVEVCYIFFPRPDKQQRPIACFTLAELIEASTVDETIYEGPGAAVFDASNAVDTTEDLE